MPAKRKTSSTKTNYTKKRKTTSTKSAKLGTVTRKPGSKVELKRLVQYNDVNISGNSAALVLLPCPTPGDLSYQRDGRSIQLKAFQSRWVYNPATNAESCNFRVIYFIWKQRTTPVLDDILKTIGGSTAIMCSPYNILQSSNYQILSDDTYNANPMCLNKANANVYCPNIIMFNKSKALNMTQAFDDTNAFVDKALYMFIISHSQCNVHGEIGVSYIDI